MWIGLTMIIHVLNLRRHGGFMIKNDCLSCGVVTLERSPNYCPLWGESIGGLPHKRPAMWGFGIFFVETVKTVVDFSLMLARTHYWTNYRVTGDWRHHDVHIYDVAIIPDIYIVLYIFILLWNANPRRRVILKFLWSMISINAISKTIIFTK